MDDVQWEPPHRQMLREEKSVQGCVHIADPTPREHGRGSGHSGQGSLVPSQRNWEPVEHGPLKEGGTEGGVQVWRTWVIWAAGRGILILRAAFQACCRQARPGADLTQKLGIQMTTL